MRENSKILSGISFARVRAFTSRSRNDFIYTFVCRVTSHRVHDTINDISMSRFLYHLIIIITHSSFHDTSYRLHRYITPLRLSRTARLLKIIEPTRSLCVNREISQDGRHRWFRVGEIASNTSGCNGRKNHHHPPRQANRRSIIRR